MYKIVAKKFLADFEVVWLFSVMGHPFSQCKLYLPMACALCMCACIHVCIVDGLCHRDTSAVHV